MARFARTLLLLLLAALLPGCSTITIVYNQADHVAAWLADDYFDLTPDQKDALRRQLARVHAWHRTEQLPDYAALLEAAKGRMAVGLTDPDIDWVIDSIKARYRTLATHWHADAVRMLGTIADEQLAATRREFEKANRKYAKENGLGAPPEERQRLQVRRTLERIEHWTGSLTAEQETRIGELIRALPPIAEARQQYRMRRQQEFLALMAQRRDPAVFGPRLREWLVDWEKSRSPEYAQLFSRYSRANQDMYLAIERMLTREQRDRVLARLQRYIDAMRQLAREAPRSAPATAQ